MTSIVSRAIGIKIGNIQIPISCGEVSVRREMEEVFSFSSPLPIRIPTQEIISWRAEVFVTNECLQLEGTYWYDNLMQLLTRPESIDYEINLSERTNISVRGPIDIEISEDLARDLQIVRLSGEGVLQSGSRDEGLDRRVYTSSTFTSTALGAAIHEQATELLCMFLAPEQAAKFKEKGCFDYIDERSWTWRFIRRYHWPVEVWRQGATRKQDEFWNEGQKYKKLCLDIDPRAPTEDILLWVYLQVKGGRGEEVLKTAKGA